MTNTTPALTIDSLAAATIAFYILSSPIDHIRAAFAEYDDASLTDITLDELNENELLFDLFIDSSIPYDANDIDAITDFDFDTPEFRSMIQTAYANHRRMILDL